MFRRYIGIIGKVTLKMTSIVDKAEVTRMSDTDEMKMTGLILSQSALVGIAVGVYSSGIWLPGGSDADSMVNGITYAMGALAVQTIAYYLFKMCFEQGLKEKGQIAEMQRQRQNQFRQQQLGFDQRRADLELRVQEMQLENELRLLHEDPSRISPSIMTEGTIMNQAFNPGVIPTHDAKNDAPMNLGVDEAVRLKKDGTPDLRYKAKRGDE